MSGVRAQRLMMRRGEAEAREQARQDGLTEIGNRRGFEEAIENEIARAGRMDTPLSVAMADIERFKSVNDSFGHLEGDQILRRVPETISNELRSRTASSAGGRRVHAAPPRPRAEWRRPADRAPANHVATCAASAPTGSRCRSASAAPS